MNARGEVVKTQLTREQKLDKTLAWAKGLTEDQRYAFMVSDKFGALTDRQQDIIAEAFGQIEDKAYEDSIGIADVDLDAQLPDVDAIVGDEDDEFEADDSYVDPVDAAYLNGETNYYTGEESQ